MTEFGKCFGNILWHGDVNVAVGVIPIESETKVAGASEVLGEDIFRFKGIEKMIEISLIIVLDTEIIDSESEGGAELVVLP